MMQQGLESWLAMLSHIKLGLDSSPPLPDGKDSCTLVQIVCITELHWTLHLWTGRTFEVHFLTPPRTYGAV